MSGPDAADRPTPPGFWRTLLVLLGAARQRADGRRKRQRKLFRQRTGNDDDTLGCLGVLFTILVAIATHAAGAFVTVQAVEAGQRIAVERQGHLVVNAWFLKGVTTILRTEKGSARVDDLQEAIENEALERAHVDDSSKTVQARKLTFALHAHGTADLVTPRDAVPGLLKMAPGGLPALFGSLALLVWSMMVVLQGEGLELDVQRRRHPMWEWLFSHPAPPGAVFLAEMLAPIAANPTYWTAPLFPAILYWVVYGPAFGVAAAALVGVPIMVAAACLGKALEAAVMLRTTPRSRGALIGLMGWLGFSTSMLLFMAWFAVSRIAAVLAQPLAPLANVPWPWLGLMLGQRGDGSFSFLLGVATCWAVAGVVTLGSVALSVWGASAGLTGRIGRRDGAPTRAGGRPLRFGANPLVRKELTWFARDRSALIQAILVPLTMSAFQLFNMRGLLMTARSDWAYLCGGAVILGTYFLATLGPRSLASEGSTLWIALTWPASLESLLKAKARLWALVSTVVVALALGYALWLYPSAWLGIGLVAAGWVVFARAMSEKAVTLATVTSESGEVQAVPRGRYWATQLGTFSFAIGVLTRQWPLAVIGIVYSSLTAAAMWQNFRARLPFLLDPWSERLPRAPTLMHAMIAISGLVDGGALLTGLMLAAAGREGAAAVAFPIAYGIAAAVVSFSVGQFLSNRGVDASDVWLWPRSDRDGAETPGGTTSAFQALPAGLGLGLALGLFGCLYIEALRHVPWLSQFVQMPSEKTLRPDLRFAIFAAAVMVAPPAEEYLFRGLLFRALDREWGGWRAVVGSAVFFASYHPVLSWLPVGLLGGLNATLFKRTGRLWAAVLAHMVYNAVVLGWQFLV